MSREDLAQAILFGGCADGDKIVSVVIDLCAFALEGGKRSGRTIRLVYIVERVVYRFVGLFGGMFRGKQCRVEQ